MRVLITGQSGTCKKEFAEKLRRYVLQKRGFSPDNPSSRDACEAEIKWFEVESEEWLGADFRTFVNNYDEEIQFKTWSEAIQSVNNAIQGAKPKDCLLLTHAAWYRNGRFYSPISWDGILLFQPDCIITLIDDIYDVWQRIETGKHDTHLSLDEILAWRSVEISVSRSISLNLKLNQKNLGIKKIPTNVKPFFGEAIPNFVMSVKHPMETFYRLIFERPKRPVVYASFPITRTRGKDERIEDINSFRQNLQEAGAIVIDPLTIDEMRMDKDNIAWLELKENTKFQEYQNKRWKIVNPAIEPPDEYKNPFENLSSEQIKTTAMRIAEQVVERDFRLVAQSEKLIAYRPFYPEQGEGKLGDPPSRPTDGVINEINFALRLAKSAWAFFPKCDWSQERQRNFFQEYATWKSVNRFPTQTNLSKLPEEDFTGFGILLTELSKEIKQD